MLSHGGTLLVTLAMHLLTVCQQCKAHGLQAYAYEHQNGEKFVIVNLSKLPKSEILREGERRPIEHERIITAYFVDNGTSDEFITAMRTVLDRNSIRAMEMELGIEGSAAVVSGDDDDDLIATQATHGSSPAPLRLDLSPDDRYSPFESPEYSPLQWSQGTSPPDTPVNHRRSITPVSERRARSASPDRTRRRSDALHVTGPVRKHLESEDVVAELCLAIRDVGYEFWAGRDIPTLEELTEFVEKPITDLSMSNKGRALLLKLGLQPSNELRITRHRQMQGIWAPSSRNAVLCRNCYRSAQVDCTWHLCSHHCVDIGGLGASCAEEYHVSRSTNTGALSYSSSSISRSHAYFRA